MLARAVVNAALILLLSQLTSACDKLVFEEHSGVRYKGDVIQIYSNIELDQCRRICTLYAECEAFNMIWSAESRTKGTCEVFDVKGRLWRNFLSDRSSSFFCKHSYIYFAKFDTISCFSCRYLHIPLYFSCSFSWNTSNIDNDKKYANFYYFTAK